MVKQKYLLPISIFVTNILHMEKDMARNYHRKVIGDPQDINFMEKWLDQLSEPLLSGLMESISNHHISLEDIKNGNAKIELLEETGNYPTRQQIYLVNGVPLLEVNHKEDNLKIKIIKNTN